MAHLVWCDKKNCQEFGCESATTKYQNAVALFDEQLNESSKDPICLAIRLQTMCILFCTHLRRIEEAPEDTLAQRSFERHLRLFETYWQEFLSYTGKEEMRSENPRPR